MNISCMCAHRAAWIKHFLSYLVSDSMSSGIDQKNPQKTRRIDIKKNERRLIMSVTVFKPFYLHLIFQKTFKGKLTMTTNLPVSDDNHTAAEHYDLIL